MEKREQVLRIVEMFSSSKGFDPQTLTPFSEALRQPSATLFVQNVAAGLAERIAARVVNAILINQDLASTTAPKTEASNGAAAAAR